MTKKEIMSFQGQNFIYDFNDGTGDTMKAYIKKIDLDKNLMSCWSFSLTTDKGYKFNPMDEDEEREEACCIASRDNLEEIIELIIEIKTTGKLVNTENYEGYFSGCPF